MTSLSNNSFNDDENAVNQLIQAMKLQKNLFHFGLSMASTTHDNKGQEHIFKSSEYMVALFNVRRLSDSDKSEIGESFHK